MELDRPAIAPGDAGGAERAAGDHVTLPPVLTVDEAARLEAFQARFLDYSEVNNKPSTAYAKRWVLREHLVPAFGTWRLDAIGAADVEAYKARKLRDGQAAKSVNTTCASSASS